MRYVHSDFRIERPLNIFCRYLGAITRRWMESASRNGGEGNKSLEEKEEEKEEREEQEEQEKRYDRSLGRLTWGAYRTS